MAFQAFTVAGDFINAHIVQPVENFYKNKVEPFFEGVATEAQPVLIQLEDVAAKYWSQFEQGIGQDAMNVAIEFLNNAENLTDLHDVVAFAEKISAELISEGEKLFVGEAKQAVADSQNIILNAARTALTAAVISKATTTVAPPAETPNPEDGETSGAAASGAAPAAEGGNA